MAYRIAQDVRLPARRADRSIVAQRDCRYDAEGGREGERGGLGFDGNRLTKEHVAADEAVPAGASIKIPATWARQVRSQAILA